MRALALVAVLALGCAADDTDPDSETCKDIRAKYLEIQVPRDMAAKAGIDVTAIDVKLQQLVNKHWSCFH